MNTIYFKAKSLANNLKNKALEILTKKDAGIEQVVLILIIIAVAAGVIGAFYIWAKSTLVPAVEGEISNRVTDWFKPN